MSEIVIEVKAGNNDLPGDIRSRIAGKLGAKLFLVEENTTKSEALKNPIKFRSYRSVEVHGTEIHTGEGNLKGIKINKGEFFFHGKNTKVAGSGQNSNKGGENNNGGDNKSFLIAFDENAARKESVDFNVVERERVSGVIKSLEILRDQLTEMIEADGGVK